MIPKLTILSGDCMERLLELPDNSVQCCVTSPPYFGLRNYQVPPTNWPAVSYSPMPGIPPVTVPAMTCCLGLEPTIDAFVGHIVLVFQQVKRVLRPDGTLWMNFGDSYHHGGPGARDQERWPKQSRNDHRPGKNRSIPEIKVKDMVGIPWRTAFALQADGWYLRSDIIWHKPNPMPESVCDRPTKSHEYIYLLTKSPKYFYDAEAILEDCSPGTHARISQDVQNQIGSERANGGAKTAVPGQGIKNNDSFDSAMAIMPFQRNKRTVWTVATFSYSDAHFATFPPDLIKPCILAGTSPSACELCGSPMERQVEKGEPDLEHQRKCGGDVNGEYHGQATKDYATHKAQDASATKARILAGMCKKTTTGWTKTCKCDSQGTGKCTVLDPFGGSGTTGQVSLELGRHAILVEISSAYIPLIEQRCSTTPGLGI